MPSEPRSPVRDALGDPALRRSLADFVRRRVPAADVDDVVQTVLCDALAAPNRPSDPTELRRWLFGVAKRKVADRHRLVQREPPTELPEIPEGPPPLEARALVRWAERQAGEKDEAQRTLAWMAREGEGEKLAAIAADEKVSPERVRQRVSRMRRWMKERWAAELAAAAMIATVALAAWWLLRRRVEPPVAHDLPRPEPTMILPEPPQPLDRARALRADALLACSLGQWRTCLDGLDQARGLDPAGDQAPDVGAARAGAEAGLRAETPAPTVPAPSPKSAPPLSTTTVPPSLKPTAPKLPSKSDSSDGKAPSFDAPPQPKTPGTGSGSGTIGGSKLRGVKKRAASVVVDSPRFSE